MRPPCSNLSSVGALVELLISDARYVLTVDDKRRIIRDGAVAIEDMEIVDVGKSSELKRKYSRGRKDRCQRQTGDAGTLRLPCSLLPEYGSGYGIYSSSNATCRFRSGCRTQFVGTLFARGC